VSLYRLINFQRRETLEESPPSIFNIGKILYVKVFVQGLKINKNSLFDFFLLNLGPLFLVDADIAQYNA
jgi:hypothetical protein